MHVSSAKHSYVWPRKAWLPRKCDYQTDSSRTKWSLCAAMLRRRHNKPGIILGCEIERFSHTFSKKSHLIWHNIFKIFYWILSYEIFSHCSSKPEYPSSADVHVAWSMNCELFLVLLSWFWYPVFVAFHTHMKPNFFPNLMRIARCDWVTLCS